MAGPDVDAAATRALGRELVDTFGRGWEEGNLDLLLSAFREDAIFFESPFGEPLRGREAIRAYWRDIPAHQAEITFKSGEIFAVGPWFAAEFRCTFRRRRTGQWVEVRGAMFCETEQERVSEMRLYWQRSAEGHAPR